VSVRSILAKFRGHDDFHLNIVGRSRMWFVISGLVIVASLAGLLFRPLNFSIDFEGGARMSFEAAHPVTTDDVERVLLDQRLGGDSTVQIVEGDRVEVRLPELTEADRDVLAEALAKEAGIPPSEVNVEKVSATWGGQISRKALQGLIIFLILVTLYITMRFEWKMAMGALLALFHDLVITAGVYALTGREITPETVIAILTILGYSLYDTVVIYDKVQENTENLALVAREGYSNVVNLSLNQVFMRSVNTSLVVLLPVGTLLVLGGETLKDFAFALFVGLIAGAYSSIFVAAPFLAILKEREPRYRAIRERLTARPARSLRSVSAGGDGQPAALQPAGVSSSPRPSGGGARPGGGGGKRAGARKKKKPRRR
jgi:preprotein translocase subunit SecF